MAATLRNADIVKGSSMEIWLNHGTTGGATGAVSTDTCVAFATDHSLSISVETTEISTKSHGDYAAQLPTRISWSASASNLYCDDGAKEYLRTAVGMKPVGVKFAIANNYNGYQDLNGAEPGIVAPVFEGQDNNLDPDWGLGTVIAQGDAIITQLDINAPAGDNATLSIQLQGVGSLTQVLGVTGLPSQGGGGGKGDGE